MNKLYLIILIFLTFFSCIDDKLSTVIINGKKIYVELAITMEEQKQGLMNRDSLKNNHGMLFIGDEDVFKSFWMKNTKIPLSLAYIKSDGTILEIYDMVPYDETSVSSINPVKYVLEVNKSYFKKNNINIGDKVYFSKELKDRIRNK